MSSWQNRLRDVARERLNRLQDRVAAVEAQGGLQGVAERLFERLEQREQELWERARALDPEEVARVRRWYARLELEFGAGDAEVKQAYLRLMRLYHPDRFTRSPEDEQLATRLSQELTMAHEGIQRWLARRPRLDGSR